MEIPEVSVVVEQSIHDALKEVAQRIFDEFAIALHGVAFTWREEGTLANSNLAVSSVEIRSTTNH
jgi:hypothetical protein